MLERLEKKYSPREKMPLGGYAIITGIFGGLLAITLNESRKHTEKTRRLNDRDLIMAGIATHKLARIITKDAVTSFLRAPFTSYKEDLGYGELSEKPRGQGAAEVFGELMNCTYCMSAWTGLGIYFGLARFPTVTRSFTRFLSIVAVSDFLHVFYEERRTQSNVLTLEENKLDRQNKRAS